MATPYLMGYVLHLVIETAELGAVNIEDIGDPRVSPLDYVMWL